MIEWFIAGSVVALCAFRIYRMAREIDELKKELRMMQHAANLLAKIVDEEAIKF